MKALIGTRRQAARHDFHALAPLDTAVRVSLLQCRSDLDDARILGSVFVRRKDAVVGDEEPSNAYITKLRPNNADICEGHAPSDVYGILYTICVFPIVHSVEGPEAAYFMDRFAPAQNLVNTMREP